MTKAGFQKFLARMGVFAAGQEKAMAEAQKKQDELHAAQLLKHALGLVRLGAPATTLVYLYYDWPSPESAQHATELERFRARLGADVDFRVLTYQSLYAALCATSAGPVGYRTYLGHRYFTAGSTGVRRLAAVG